MANQSLTAEELNQLKTFKAQLNQITFALGENRIIKDNLLSSYRNVIAQEKEFHNKLSIKYGDGSIDLNTGEVIPLENE